MAGVGSRAIEVKVKSCRDLKAFNFFQKLSVYAVVSVVSETKKKKTVHAHQKTPIDRKGNGNPEWNHKIRFDLKEEEDEDNLFLEFQLLCEVIVFGRDKAIGEVRVPIRDLVEEEEEELRGGGGGGTVRLMSYQIRGSNGNPNGVLDFSYKVVLINHSHNHNHNHNHNRDDEMKNKIDDDDNTNNIVYPKIESIEFHHQASLLYPPLSPPPPPPPPPPLGIVHYPTYDDINYLPPLPLPLPLPEQIHHQPNNWKVRYMAQTIRPPPRGTPPQLAPPDPCGLSGSLAALHSPTAYPTKNDYFCDSHPSQYTGYVAGYRDVW